MTATMTTYDFVRQIASDRTCETTNALMEQKNAIFDRVNYAAEPEHFALAFDYLKLVTPLWKSLSYGYKARELADQLVIRLYLFLRDFKETRDTIRRGTSKRNFIEGKIRLMDTIFTDVCIYRDALPIR